MSENKKVVKKLDYPHNITLYKNGSNKNIYYYFTYKKIVYQGSTGVSDEKSSIEKVCDIFYEVKNGSRIKGTPKLSTFKEVCRKYLKYQENQNLSPRTLEEYKRQSRFLIERLGNKDVRTLCSKGVYDDYQRWRREYYQTHETKKVIKYKRDGKVLKGRTLEIVGSVPINRECRFLVSVLRYSKYHLNLLSGIEIPSYKMLKETRREEILTKEEYLRLEEYWMKKNPYYWMILSFLNNTGLRYPNELNNIKWKDVHLDKSYVLIRDRKSRKSKDPLDTPVPLIGTSKEIIEKLWSRENVPKGEDDPVFLNDKGIQIKNIRSSFKKSLKDCNISDKIVIYSFRHLFTTRMVKRSDIPLITISEVLGHRDTTMISRHYSHLRISDLVDIFQRSEDHKQEILKKQKEQNDIEI